MGKKSYFVHESSYIDEDVELEDSFFCGPSCVFTNDLTPRARYPKDCAGYRKTLVRKRASIGANATIVCDHTVGRWALIGVGAVVTNNVPDHALMLGVPARLVGYVCECGAQMKFEDDRAVCAACGRTYQKSPDGDVEEA